MNLLQLVQDNPAQVRQDLRALPLAQQVELVAQALRNVADLPDYHQAWIVLDGLFGPDAEDLAAQGLQLATIETVEAAATLRGAALLVDALRGTPVEPIDALINVLDAQQENPGPEIHPKFGRLDQIETPAPPVYAGRPYGAMIRSDWVPGEALGEAVTARMEPINQAELRGGGQIPLSSDGRLVSLTVNNHIALLDTVTMRVAKTGIRGRGLFVPRTNYLVVIDGDRMRAVNSRTLEDVWVVDLEQGIRPKAVAADPRGRFVAIANENVRWRQFMTSLYVAHSGRLEYSQSSRYRPLDLSVDPTGTHLARLGPLQTDVLDPEGLGIVYNLGSPLTRRARQPSINQSAVVMLDPHRVLFASITESAIFDARRNIPLHRSRDLRLLDDGSVSFDPERNQILVVASNRRQKSLLVTLHQIEPGYSLRTLWHLQLEDTMGTGTLLSGLAVVSRGNGLTVIDAKGRPIIDPRFGLRGAVR